MNTQDDNACPYCNNDATINCGNCHGPAGMGLASYPKLKGKEIPYLIDRLNTYRAGTKIGPNSDLMIMMAQPLSDVEIANLAAYLNAQK